VSRVTSDWPLASRTASLAQVWSALCSSRSSAAHSQLFPHLHPLPRHDGTSSVLLQWLQPRDILPHYSFARHLWNGHPVMETLILMASAAAVLKVDRVVESSVLMTGWLFTRPHNIGYTSDTVTPVSAVSTVSQHICRSFKTGNRSDISCQCSSFNTGVLASAGFTMLRSLNNAITSQCSATQSWTMTHAEFKHILQCWIS